MGNHFPTRRAFLGSVGIAATIGATAAMALVADPVAREAEDARNYDDGFLDGCDEARCAMAASWLSRFTAKGGSIIPQPDGTVMIGCVEYWCSPQHDADVKRYSAGIPDDAMTMLRDRYEGAMRELIEQVEHLPGLRKMLRAIVAANPRLGFSSPREA